MQKAKLLVTLPHYDNGHFQYKYLVLNLGKLLPVSMGNLHKNKKIQIMFGY